MTRGHEDRRRRRLTATEVDLGVARQRAVIVAVAPASERESADASLDELELLVDTAGATTVARELQVRPSPEGATFVGAGKLDELATTCAALDVDLVVVDGELTPAQQRNLERRLSVDVVDRVALILDIFAQHAHSQEGMVQVELAQLRYRLPRLRGRGVELSRLGGGIGTRGPGETQLETDRRRILRRIGKLERDLARLRRTRTTQRKARRRHELPTVALVGYTNAGKSTLLNRLTDAGVLVGDRLFSTLDPTTRRLTLGGGEAVLLSDTVGFVRKLPHELVEAFRSTLEEVTDAALLVHVVDASSPTARGEIAAVRNVLALIEADRVPELVAANKVDLADPADVGDLVRIEEAVPVSALTGEGVDKLLDAVARRLRAGRRIVELRIPYARGEVLAAVHREGDVLVEVHEDDCTRVRVRLPDAALSRFGDYGVDEESVTGGP